MSDSDASTGKGTRAQRILDVIIVLATAPAWVPVLLLSAGVALVTQGRPVLFRQARVGAGGEAFELLKLRTMINDADQYLDVGGQPTRQRVTPFGARLRRSGLDELPQLLNVLRGDMSLVGPRPVLPLWLDRIPGGANHARFRVRPGITGLAQIDGRNTVLWSRRLELDGEFATSPTVFAYVKILLATPAALLRPTVSSDRNSSEVDDLTPGIENDPHQGHP